jgi:hypothetical protein
MSNETIQPLSRSILVSSSPRFSTKGQFERIPKWLNLVPMIAQWLWLSLKYGSVSLPSSANPTITSGGMVGDGKLEYFDCMGKIARACTADYISFKADKDFSLEQSIKEMEVANLQFPIVAKPDLGWCGYGVRLINNPQELLQYVQAYPKGETFLLQRFIPDQGEAGLFYVRHPHEEKGRILGILLRYYPKVTGDGYHNIKTLIARDARLQRLINNKLHECSFDPDYVPKYGEQVRLSLIGSTRVGGLYMDGTSYTTPELTEKLDIIAKDMKDFYIGRFDVRYKNAEELAKGKFIIMEVNGSGSEAVHAWDPKYTIPEVYKIVFAKQRILFSIADINRKLGHKPIGLIKLAQLHLHQQDLMRRYPRSN